MTNRIESIVKTKEEIAGRSKNPDMGQIENIMRNIEKLNRAVKATRNGGVVENMVHRIDRELTDYSLKLRFNRVDGFVLCDINTVVIW